ncbi:UNVERIFIED_CONTAM: hypothetical protein FKN15_045225 [Acipenser sinensis]
MVFGLFLILYKVRRIKLEDVAIVNLYLSVHTESTVVKFMALYKTIWCGVLKEKLDSLLKTLNEESQASSCLPNPPPTIAEEQEEGEGLGLQEPPVERHAPPAPCPPRTNPGIFKPREQLMLRANSLKKAIRQIIEHTEKAVDEQNAQTQEQEVFALGTSLEEEEGRSEDKVSLQSSHSGNNSCVNAKGRGARKVSKSPCEKLISKGSLSLGSSSSLPAQTGNRDNMPMLSTKILYSSLRASLSGSLPGSSVIGRLLVNADPFNYDPESHDCYTEKCVMNNYFGIGLDAKISLDFNNKRDEHPEKCRSRTKNMMWYGVLGTKELLHRTYKNLEQKVLLECRTVKITVLGEEGVPVQVDGEAWVQPPGYIRIIHKNRTPTLTRDRAFENTLKSWEDKQKCEFPRPSAQLALLPEIVSEEEASQINLFGQSAGALIHSIREIAQSHQRMEQELAHAVNASSKSMDVVYAKSKNTEGLNCSVVFEMVNNVKALHNETELLLAGKMCLVSMESMFAVHIFTVLAVEGYSHSLDLLNYMKC